MNNVERLLRKQGGSGSNSHENVAYYLICGGDHDSVNCFQVEQVHNINNYNLPPQNNSF